MPRKTCENCGQKFNKEAIYHAHMKVYQSLGKCAKKTLQCSFCNEVFSSMQNKRNHEKHYHCKGKVAFPCGLCPNVYVSVSEVERHRKEAHKQGTNTDFVLQKSAHRKSCQLLRAFLPPGSDLNQSLEDTHDNMLKLMKDLAVEHPAFKINLIVNFELFRMNDENEVDQIEVFPFRAFGISVGRQNFQEAARQLQLACGDIERNVDEFLMRGSGWIISRALFIDAEVAVCNNLVGYGCKLHEAKFLRSGSFFY